MRDINYISTEPILLVIGAYLIGTSSRVGQVSNRNEIILANFHFRQSNPAQEYDSTCDKELLAIMYALAHFSSLFTGCKFTILTDHNSLNASFKTCDLIEKCTTWKQILDQFDCTIEHLKGDKHVIANAFLTLCLNNSILRSLSDFIPQSAHSILYLQAPTSTFYLSSSTTVPHSASMPPPIESMPPTTRLQLSH